MVSRDENRNKRGIKKFINSFKYPMEGLKYTYLNEQNFTVDILIGIIVIIAGLILKISYLDWIILFIVIGLVLSFELFNTSIERVCDLASKKYHPLAKAAKDVSAAAVFVMAIVAIIVGLLIFIPRIIELL